MNQRQPIQTIQIFHLNAQVIQARIEQLSKDLYQMNKELDIIETFLGGVNMEDERYFETQRCAVCDRELVIADSETNCCDDYYFFEETEDYVCDDYDCLKDFTKKYLHRNN